MRTQKSQKSKEHKVPKSGPACTTEQRFLKPSQIALIDFILFHEPLTLSRSLQKIHDIALYFSDHIFDTEEKTALYDVKLLSNYLAQQVEENHK